MPWQRAVADVACEIDPETGRLFYQTVVVTVMRQQGKGLALDTPIPTPSGWTTMGALEAGDQVFDENGAACTVRAATEPRELDCYRMVFSDGSELVADGDHLWSVRTRMGPWSTLSTRDMVGREREPAGEARWRLPQVSALQCAGADLSIDPYLLGVWLGDGTSTSATITSGDADTDEMSALIESTGAVIKSRRQDPRTGAWSLRVALPGRVSDGFGPRLRQLGVWGKGNKHIPDVYLRASVEQRVELLRGLMDTDGCVTATGTHGTSRQCELTSCTEQLGSDVLELVRSLGIRATCARDSATLGGEHVGWRWRVRFTAPFPVFKLKRKAEKQAESGPLRTRLRTIQSITPVETVPTKCIKVDSPSSLYLAGSALIPTHNTSLLLPVWAHRAVTWPNVRVAWTMQSAQAARSKWAEEHVPRIQASPLARLLEPGSKGVRMQNGSEHVKFRNGSMQTLLASTMSAGHGDVVDLGMVDEAMAQRDDRLHQALKPAMKTRHRDGMPGAQLWVVSTMGPDGESVWFNAQVDAGRQAVEQGTCEEDRICYVEYSAPEDADPGDPEVWRACMPALGFTVDEQTIRAEYREALLVPDGLAGFRRQALNQRTAQRSDPPFPLEVWDGLVADAERPQDGLVWAVDVSPDQASAAVGLAWFRADGVPQVQVVDHRPGVGWLQGRVAELRDRWPGVWVLDPRGASGSVVAWWPGVQLPAAEARRSCAVLEAAVRSGGLGHFGQPGVRAALEGAVRRPSQDGGWQWARRGTTVDISPLVAVSLALGGLVGGAVSAPAGDPLLSFF